MIFIATILLLAATAVNSQIPQRGGVRPYDVRPYDVRPYDETPKPYSFSYNEVLEDGGQISRTETADGTGKVQGSYSQTDLEGHTRIVDYVSDEYGFRAHVRTNEPGTDNQNPADVIFESNSPYANRLNYQSGGGARPFAGNRPVLNAPEGVAPVEPIAPIDVIPDNVRRPVGVRRPVYRPSGGRNPFGRV